ncbi:hypothetical protein [Nocardia sp. NPDC057030]|uniref:hypothetical protein n=1 Tax=unclassified Nocardia TaxID=2637762 RepID=UPI00362B61D6
MRRGERADADHRPAIAITGMGGIGKTAFAMYLAHHVRGAYPDGSLYLDLGGLDEHPPSADALVAGALRKIGVGPGELPTDAAGRTALWRSAITDKRILISLRAAYVQGAVLTMHGAESALIAGRRPWTPA